MGAANPVAEKINFSLFESAATSKQVSILGRLAEGNKLTTTDGGVLTVVCDQDLKADSLKGFGEVIGAKEDASALRVHSVLCLVEKVDVELWDEAVKMSHQPQLRELFAPAAISVP